MGICLVCCLFLSACGQESPSTKLETFQDGEEIQQMDEDTNIYQYLTKTELNMKDGSTLKLYIPADPSIDPSQHPYASSLNGVSVENKLKKSNLSLEKIHEQSCKKEQKWIKKQNKKAKQKGKLIEKDTHRTTYYTYQIKQKDGIYPCFSIVKTEKISNGIFLKTVIRLDNRKTTDISTDVLKEVYDAYGIEQKEE